MRLAALAFTAAPWLVLAALLVRPVVRLAGSPLAAALLPLLEVRQGLAALRVVLLVAVLLAVPQAVLLVACQRAKSARNSAHP